MKVTDDYCHFLCDFRLSTVGSFFEVVINICLCYIKAHVAYCSNSVGNDLVDSSTLNFICIHSGFLQSIVFMMCFHKFMWYMSVVLLFVHILTKHVQEPIFTIATVAVTY